MARTLFRELKPARKVEGFWRDYNPCEETKVRYSFERSKNNTLSNCQKFLGLKKDDCECANQNSSFCPFWDNKQDF